MDDRREMLLTVAAVTWGAILVLCAMWVLP